MTAHTITMTARQFADLVKPVLPIAGVDDMLPLLCTVRFEIHDGWLLAMTTDRFRMAIQKHPAKIKTFTANVPTRDVKLILRTFKPGRNIDPDIQLTLDADTLTVTNVGVLEDGLLAGSTLVFRVEPGQYPDLLKLVSERLATVADPAADSWVGLNPIYLAAFQHAVGRNEPLVVRHYGPNNPIIVTAGQDFIGMQMPLRVAAASDGKSAVDVSAWTALATPPKKQTRKRAAKKAAA